MQLLVACQRSETPCRNAELLLVLHELQEITTVEVSLVGGVHKAIVQQERLIGLLSIADCCLQGTEEQELLKVSKKRFEGRRLNKISTKPITPPPPPPLWSMFVIRVICRCYAELCEELSDVKAKGEVKDTHRYRLALFV